MSFRTGSMSLLVSASLLMAVFSVPFGLSKSNSLERSTSTYFVQASNPMTTAIGSCSGSNSQEHWVRLVTGDVVHVAYLPNGQRGISVVPAGPAGSDRGFVKFESSVGTYVLPNGVSLEKLDIELFNIDYLIDEGYCEMSYLPVMMSVSDTVGRGPHPVEKALQVFNGRTATLLPSASALSARLPMEAVGEATQAMLARSDVKKIWLDRKVHVSLNDSVPLIGAPELWSLGFNGTGIEIAIVDTGIDKTHPDLDDLDDNPATIDPKVIREVNFSDDRDTLDHRGHGTHCAGIAAGTGAASDGKYKGVAPGAKLWNVKVLNSEGWGYDSWVISGIQYAAYGPDGMPRTGDEADIISMSLGGEATEGEDPCSLAVDAAVDAGVVVVVAAGNEEEHFSILSPGVARKAITVGATTKQDTLAFFSSRGPTLDFQVKPDVVAPGFFIMSCVPSWSSTRYEKKAGTSMAAPHVAGAAALLIEANQNIPSGWSTPKYVKNAVISTGRDLGYNVYEQGGGRIDIPSALSTDVLADPANVGFEVSSGGNVLNETAVTFFNVNRTSNRILALSVTVYEAFSKTQVDCARLNTTVLGIDPNSNASVLLTVNATGLTQSFYSGELVAVTDTGGTVHAIFGLARICHLEIAKTNRLGFPARHDYVFVVADPGAPQVAILETDSNGNASLHVAIGSYHLLGQSYNYSLGSFTLTVAENVTVTDDTFIHLDDRTTVPVRFDPNKAGQKMAAMFVTVSVYPVFGLTVGGPYPKSTVQYISPTSISNTFSYEYYPEEYYNPASWLKIDSPEWHNLVYSLDKITGSTTLVANYSSLVRRITDFKTSMQSLDEVWRWQFACHPNLWWITGGEGWVMKAPKRMVQWLSPEPAYYYTYWTANQYNAAWVIGDSNKNKESYPPASNPYCASGEHPFTSGVNVHLGTQSLELNGTISTDTFGNPFWNGKREKPGNVTVLQDGTEIYQSQVGNELGEIVPFSDTPAMTVIIEGATDLALSTRTTTRITFTADPARDYRPPRIKMRPEGSNLDCTVPRGEVMVDVTATDESSVPSVDLEFSLDDGANWNRAAGISDFNQTLRFSIGMLDAHNYVSLRVNATDAAGNSISQTVIRGFYVAPWGDVAVKEAALSKTVIAQGQTLLVNVTIENQGFFAESSNVSVRCNETALTLSSGEQFATVTLTAGDSTTVTFLWNTTGFDKGNYNVAAFASLVPGETDAEDNVLVCDNVRIAMLGDITGPTVGIPDGRVDIRDVAMVSSAFGSYPRHPRWNSNADVNDDRKVDIADVAIVSKNFGKTDW